jgi:hypothetical protein
MERSRRGIRWFALFATGGCLLQTTGCVTGLTPVLLSVAESVILDLVLSAFFPTPL